MNSLPYEAELTAGAEPPAAGLFAALAALNAGVEREFLSVAESLRAIAGRAREITDVSREVAASSVGEESNRAIDALRETAAAAARMQEAVDRGREQLVAILGLIVQGRAPLERLLQLAQFLAAIAVMSRIEASRANTSLQEATLLTAEIGDLAKGIREYVQALADKVSVVRVLVNETLQQTAELEARRRDQRTSLVSSTRAVLDPLQASVEMARSAALDIDERYAGIRGAIDNTVMSLQVQDIARQRIEHVMEALQRSPDPAGVGRKVLALQRSQILSTRDLVLGSTSAIGDSLCALRARVNELIADTSTLAAQTAEAGSLFVGTIHGALDAVCPVFEQYAESSRQVLETDDQVVASVRGMEASVKDLQDIQVRTHRTALNAMIETARLGEDGAALRVLASEVGPIAQRSKEDAQAVLVSLLEIERVVRRGGDREESRPAGLIAREMCEVKRELTGLAGSVAAKNALLSEELNAVKTMAGALYADLQHAGELAEQEAAIAGLFERVLDGLSEALSRAGDDAEAGGEDGETEGQQRLAAMYSMDSERDLHQQFFSVEPAADSVPPSGAAYESIDLGDGIELF